MEEPSKVKVVNLDDLLIPDTFDIEAKLDAIICLLESIERKIK